jgi:sulfide:quinone oxidoreductase
MSLMKESRINHAGKMLFKWIYWNMLLRGRDLPTVSAQMTMLGKRYPKDFAEKAPSEA